MAYKYIFLDHTADVAVDVDADTLDELFTAAAFAWRDSISDDKESSQSQERSLVLSENGLEILLVSFLSELNFLYQSKSWMMNSIKYIEIGKKDDGWTLSLKILGGNFNRNDMKLKSEIKAITYHQMEIKEKNEKFSTRIVFDI
jgi:SHS2 domain-containing protein